MVHAAGETAIFLRRSNLIRTGLIDRVCVEIAIARLAAFVCFDFCSTRLGGHTDGLLTCERELDAGGFMPVGLFDMMPHDL